MRCSENSEGKELLEQVHSSGDSMGNSFGCSASGERLVSAARDGDLQEAQALLDCNPRLAKYSTFGVRNSPLHFSAMQGHNEVGIFLLLSEKLFTPCVCPLVENFDAYDLLQSGSP